MVNIDPLTELVGFLRDKNPQVRAVAAQELVPYSTRGHPRISIFKSDGFRPITDLRILTLDEPKTAHDSLTILINLSQDPLIRAKLVDDMFINMLLCIIINPTHGLADLACMLLANLAKSDSIKSLLTYRKTPVENIRDTLAMNQLLDVYVQGHSKKYNQYANYDFLTNLFSDLTRFKEGRDYFLNKQEYDDLIPLQKLIVQTDIPSQLRRTGIASVIKNCCFDTSKHPLLLDESGLNLLEFLQAPLVGPDEDFKDDELDGLFESLQFTDKEREKDPFTITILLDALLLLCSTRHGRDHLRRRQTYPIVRQLHLQFGEDEEIGECCDKLVNILMRDDDPDIEDLDPIKVQEGLQADLAEEEEDEEDGIMEV